MLQFGLEGITIKLEKKNFLPTSNKFAMQNDPLMQLSLIFHRIVNKTTRNPEDFRIIGLVVSTKKTVTGVEGRGGKFVLFLLLFLSVHINFQYKLNSHKNFFFLMTIIFLFFYCFTYFSHLEFQFSHWQCPFLCLISM